MTGRSWSILVVRLAIAILGFSWGCNSIQCKAGWQEWNEACYKFFDELKEFSVALASCKNDSANLVSIHSAQENEFVRTLTGGKDVFVGLTDSDVEGMFVWVDSSTATYVNWEAGEPNDDFGIGDCVILLGSTGKWNDTPCIMWYKYVCKFTNAQPSQGKDSSAMSKEQSFISYEQKALVNHVIYTKMTPSLIHCALLCINNPACKTINYKSERQKDERTM
ncbi:hypothetical protein ACROYT_G005673 [Oculina patagonica]